MLLFVPKLRENISKETVNCANLLIVCSYEKTREKTEQLPRHFTDPAGKHFHEFKVPQDAQGWSAFCFFWLRLGVLSNFCFSKWDSVVVCQAEQCCKTRGCDEMVRMN